MKQKGFTLIELIVVIVILGILAATALPKFMDLGGDARKASIQALEGSMRGANSMVYAKAAVAGKLAVGDTVAINTGTNVTTNYGFLATVSGFSSAMDLSSEYEVDATTSTIRMKSAPDKTTCMVTYTAATSTAVPPTYQQTVSGC